MAAEPVGHTLQPTALVHEAYLRLQHDPRARWDSHRHFLGAAARAMRRILVERARRQASVKHGGRQQRLSLDDGDLLAPERAPVLLAVDEALQRLEGRKPRQAEIVRLRYFAGLTVNEIAAVLGLSASMVKLDWNYARAWLHRELERDGVLPANLGSAPAGDPRHRLSGN